jgi:predicted ATPase
MPENLKFSHLTLFNWRNFAEVDISLQNRVFIVGPNAAGKSNLLDVFRFLHDIVVIGGGFQEAVRKRGGVSQLKCMNMHRGFEIRIRIRLEDNRNRTFWDYELWFDGGDRPLIAYERVWRNGELLLDRPDDKDKRDEERLTQTVLEQVAVNAEFREIADLLNWVGYNHISPQLIRNSGPLQSIKSDPSGNDLLLTLARWPKQIINKKVNDIFQVMRVVVPQLQKLEYWEDKRGNPHLRLRNHFWPEHEWQTEEQFSDGTLRLIGILWAMMEAKGPILLEEPELSLHPGVIRYLPQLLARIQRKKGLQTIITTQSPYLLQDTAIGLDEVLLLTPNVEGTTGTSARFASDFPQIRTLLEAGLGLDEVVLPETQPGNVQELSYSV